MSQSSHQQPGIGSQYAFFDPGVVRQVYSHLEAMIWWGQWAVPAGHVATAVGIPGWWHACHGLFQPGSPGGVAVLRPGTLVCAAAGGLKNIVGAVLVLLGVIMLVTPGQEPVDPAGGAAVNEFSGKYHLERWLVQRPGVIGRSIGCAGGAVIRRLTHR